MLLQIVGVYIFWIGIGCYTCATQMLIPSGPYPSFGVCDVKHSQAVAQMKNMYTNPKSLPTVVSLGGCVLVKQYPDIQIIPWKPMP